MVGFDDVPDPFHGRNFDEMMSIACVASSASESDSIAPVFSATRQRPNSNARTVAITPSCRGPISTAKCGCVGMKQPQVHVLQCHLGAAFRHDYVERFRCERGIWQ